MSLKAKIEKLKSLKIPDACILTLEDGTVVMSFPFPKDKEKLNKQVRERIMKEKLVLAHEKVSGGVDRVKFWFFEPDEHDDTSRLTMKWFNLDKEEEWSDYVICARFFEKWPGGEWRSRKPPQEAEYQMRRLGGGDDQDS